MKSAITRTTIIRPPRLRPGDRIGVISPAGPVNRSDLKPGLRLLESSGFRVLVAPHVYNKREYLAGEDEARLADLHAMFHEKDLAAILCARGGYGSLRLLNKIQYDLIKANPKILVGYSDITALLIAIHEKTGLVTFHGPMVRELAQGNQSNWKSMLGLLSSKQLLKLTLTEGSAFITGRATGPLIGGNLSLICHLVGTPFLPSLDGCILFIEEKGEPLYRVDRMMTHLALTGKLKRLSGLIVGQFEGCGEPSAIKGLLADRLSDLGIPSATGLPSGHGVKNLALPLGLLAELDTDLMTLSIKEMCIS